MVDICLTAAAKLWAWLVTIFPALAGVGLAIHLDAQKAQEMNAKQMAATFFFGVSTAYFFSNFVAEHWVINPLSATFILIQFVVAAIGMSIMAQLILTIPAQIPKVVNKLGDKMSDKLDQWFGGKK